MNNYTYLKGEVKSIIEDSVKFTYIQEKTEENYNLKKGLSGWNFNRFSKKRANITGNFWIEILKTNWRFIESKPKRKVVLPKTYHSKTKTLFNKKQKITHKYYYRLDKPFLEEYNEYKSDTLLTYHIERNKILGKRKGIYKNDIFLIEKKYAYNKKQQLLTKYIKSSYQKEFNISIINHYKNNLLIKSEHLNNHINYRFYLTCQGDGSGLKDYIVAYEYDDNHRVIEKKRSESNLAFIDVKHVRKIGENFKYPFELRRITKFTYNNKKQLVKVNTSWHNDYRNGFSEKRVIKYDDNNRKLKDYRINKLNNISGNFYEYQIINDTLNRVYNGYLYNEYGSKTVLKRLSVMKDYYRNKSLKVTDFSQCEEKSYSYYDIHGNLYKIIEDGTVIYHCKYLYDKKGNWIKAIEIRNGRMEYITIREIEYYN